jgi:amino acid adenylation domain-containing protein
MTPLTAVQRRWWLLHQVPGSAGACHLSSALRLAGDLNPTVLVRALHEVGARHAVLRSLFREDATGEPRQHLTSDFRVSVPAPDDAPGDLHTAMAQVADEPFDLSAGVPVRARLWRCGPDEHVLLLVIHRIVADEASMEAMAEQLLIAYSALARGAAPEWGPGPARTPHDRSAHPSCWWQESVQVPEPQPLPVAPRRREPAGPRGDTVPFAVPAEVVSAVARTARRYGTTPRVLWHTVLTVLLHQVGGRSELLVGTPADTRSGTGEVAIGPYTELRIIRVDVSRNPSFADLLRRVRAAYLEPSTTPGDPAGERQATCQVHLDWRRTPSPPVLPGLTVTWERAPSRTAAADLAVTMAETGGELTFATDVFDRASMQRFAHRFVRAAQQVVADPALIVSRVDVLAPTEHELLTRHHTTAAVPPVSIQELVRRQIAATPDAVAVTDAGRSLTYRQVDARARAIAHHLREHGAGPETLVAVALPRTADLAIALLAVLYSGAAYLPIDQHYPGSRIRHLLADAGPVLILTDTGTGPALPRTGPPCLHLDTLDLTRGGGPGRDIDPDHLAYVMYTSGSTGTPKGVALTHAAIVNGITSLARLVHARPGALILASTSISFDVSVFEIFTALSTGATVHIVRDLLAAAAGWTGTVLHSVPSVLTALLDRNTPIDVDTVVLAGEGLSAPLVQRIHKAAPDASVINAYGQTESFYASAFPVPRDWEQPGGVPIGVPLANMRTRILGPGLISVPPGTPGELYVAGHIARGYFSRPALTAQRFVPDPYGPPGSRMYRTGDLARLRPDGHLDYLGRTDHQIKLRGLRVEPAEIEAVLTAHPAIDQAVVEARGGRLVAYLVPVTRGAGPDARDVRRFVADRLPPHMIPGALIALDRLPLAPNGKLDRSRLPAPPAPRPLRPEGGASVTATRSDDASRGHRASPPAGRR